MKLLLFALVLFAGLSCRSQSCKQLPATFSSYTEAVKKVKASDFVKVESANTSGSSWITSATYYSCDGKKGYLIFTTISGEDYIHADVPVEIWSGFRAAKSKGSYYNLHIKGKYILQL